MVSKIHPHPIGWSTIAQDDLRISELRNHATLLTTSWDCQLPTVAAHYQSAPRPAVGTLHAARGAAVPRAGHHHQHLSPVELVAERGGRAFRQSPGGEHERPRLLRRWPRAGSLRRLGLRKTATLHHGLNVIEALWANPPAQSTDHAGKALNVDTLREERNRRDCQRATPAF